MFTKIKNIDGWKKKKNVFFSYFIWGIPNFSYIGFFRKCSMFRRSIPWRLFIPRLQWSIFTSRRAECKINLHLFAKPQKLLRRLGNPFLATGLFLYPKNIKKRLVLFNNIFRHFKKLSVLKNFHKLSVTLICIFFKIQLIQNI